MCKTVYDAYILDVAIRPALADVPCPVCRKAMEPDTRGSMACGNVDGHRSASGAYDVAIAVALAKDGRPYPSVFAVRTADGRVEAFSTPYTDDKKSVAELFTEALGGSWLMLP